MSLAVLVGFEYQTNTLPGVVIDLYKAYKYFANINIKCMIISDSKDDKLPTTVARAITDGIVDDGIYEFREKITFNCVNNFVDIRAKLRSLDNFNRIVFYYTGHGVKNAVIMPSKEHVDVSLLRDLVLEKCNEAFFILDCCHAGGMELPFRLTYTRNIGRPHYNVKFAINDEYEAFDKRILLITSSSLNELSTAGRLGSHFTKFLFETLTECVNRRSSVSLPAIVDVISSNIRQKNTGYDQTISVYSSHQTMPMMWSWMLGYVTECDVSDDGMAIKIGKRNLKANTIRKCLQE